MPRDLLRQPSRTPGGPHDTFSFGSRARSISLRGGHRGRLRHRRRGAVARSRRPHSPHSPHGPSARDAGGLDPRRTPGDALCTTRLPRPSAARPGSHGRRPRKTRHHNPAAHDERPDEIDRGQHPRSAPHGHRTKAGDAQHPASRNADAGARHDHATHPDTARPAAPRPRSRGPRAPPSPPLTGQPPPLPRACSRPPVISIKAQVRKKYEPCHFGRGGYCPLPPCRQAIGALCDARASRRSRGKRPVRCPAIVPTNEEAPWSVSRLIC